MVPLSEGIPFISFLGQELAHGNALVTEPYVHLLFLALFLPLFLRGCGVRALDMLVISEGRQSLRDFINIYDVRFL